MMLGFSSALLTGVPNNVLSDAVPFSTAKSYESGNIVAYTITGPKIEKTRSLALGLLGFPWVMGGVMLLFIPRPSFNTPVWVVYSVLLCIGGLMCYQSIARRRIANTRYQIAINRTSGEVVLSRNKPDQYASYDEASVMVRSNAGGKNYIVTVNYGDQYVMVLGAFNKFESAEMFASILTEETGLALLEEGHDNAVHFAYVNRIARADNRALERPIRTQPLVSQFND